MLRSLVLMRQAAVQRSLITCHSSCFPAASHNRSLHTSLTTPRLQRHKEEEEGSPFVSDDFEEEPHQPTRGVASPDLISSSSSTFRSSGEGLGIVPPRRATKNNNRRADDPADRQNLIAQMNQMEIKTGVDKSVPVGTPSATSRPKPQKGGRAIHPKDVVEQTGRLTPLQIHRILSSVQQADPAWPIPRIAEHFQVDEATIENLVKNLRLPFVFQDLEKTWQGTTEEPKEVAIQRTLGKSIQLNIMGGHIKVVKNSKQ